MIWSYIRGEKRTQMEKMKILSHDEMFVIKAEAEKLEERINLLFLNREYEPLYEILSSSENKKLAERNQHIYILYIMFQIIFGELNNKGKSCLEGKTTGQLIRIYRILTLYLRRIELDFPEEKQIEMAEYIEQEKLSFETIVGIISKNVTIVYKQKVIDRISSFPIFVND